MYSQKLVDVVRGRLEAALGLPLRDYSYEEVLEFKAQMRDIEWSEDRTPSRPLSEAEGKYVFNEIHRSKIDFRYWLERYAMILDVSKRLSPLRPWPSQELLLKAIAEEEENRSDKKIRIILLKSRQIGGTAMSEALVGHMIFLNPNTQGVIASDNLDGSLKLWQTLIRLYDNLPGWMRPVKDGKMKATNLHLSLLDSDVICGAGNQTSTLGQGMTVDVVHLTEISTWQFPGYIDADLMPAFGSSRKHHTLAVLESTGAGAKGNWFHDQYSAAARNKSLFHPVFIAWYLRPSWWLDPSGVTFDDDTVKMAARVKAETGIELNRGQCAWWQLTREDLKARDQLTLFYQEYPSTVEEAFQTGLRSVFSIELRSRIRDEVRSPIFVADVNLDTKKLREVPLRDYVADTNDEKHKNRLVVWEWAKPGHVYVVGVDASYGMEEGDTAAIEVIRVGNKLRPDEQVAEWSGIISPLNLATPAEILGKVYGDKLDGFAAKMACEVNPGSPGTITQIELMRRGYPHFYIWRKPLRQDGQFSKEVGWWTTPSTRPLLTEAGSSGLKTKDLLVNSPQLINEMSSFVFKMSDAGRRKMEHADGYHDDRLMALFIAYYVAHEHDMVSIADERRKALEASKRPAAEVVQFQTTGMSWSEAVEKWEEGLDF